MLSLQRNKTQIFRFSSGSYLHIIRNSDPLKLSSHLMRWAFLQRILCSHPLETPNPLLAQKGIKSRTPLALRSPLPSPSSSLNSSPMLHRHFPKSQAHSSRHLPSVPLPGISFLHISPKLSPFFDLGLSLDLSRFLDLKYHHLPVTLCPLQCLDYLFPTLNTKEVMFLYLPLYSLFLSNTT